MKIKNLVVEDFVNYKKASMVVGFPHCTFKCEHECGKKICQNSSLVQQEDIEITPETIYKYYSNNSITEAVVIAGLEPFDDWKDLLELVKYFRRFTEDDIVIYTGYNKSEILQKITALQKYKNIVVKYGRFIPEQNKHFDEVLGVYLASDNQYAEIIS